MCPASSTSPPCARPSRARRRPGEGQPALPGRAGHRPLGHRRQVRHQGRLRPERRAGVRPQQGALPVPALGPDRLRRLQGRPARHRHRPPGEHRAPGPHSHGPGWPGVPDTLVGTDSHTTMVNGLGVLGWGVGGIEAEAAMLGQPVSMLIPRVVGFKLTGELPASTTATDLVLTITEMLRKHGVVGKFVEFYGEGVAATSLANRATIGNMSPEFGSTAAIFPIDGETLNYLKLTGRSEQQVALVEAYAKEQGLWLDPAAEPDFSEKLELDLSTVVPPSPARSARRTASSSRTPPSSSPRTSSTTSRSRPPRPAPPPPRWTRRASSPSRPPTPRPTAARRTARAPRSTPRAPAPRSRRTRSPSPPRRLHLRDRPRRRHRRRDHLLHQHLEPVRHGRRRARREEGRGEEPDPQAVGQDHPRPGLEGRHRLLRQGGPHPYLDKVGFNLVGYGCTTCIGNSGPLPEEVSRPSTTTTWP